MRTASALFAFAMTLIAACDAAPTRPDASARISDASASASHSLITGAGWTLISLPFAPHDINDAGAIVGAAPHPDLTTGSDAVVWQNGQLTVLPRIPGVGVNYVATAISPTGLIVGAEDGHRVLLWTSPTSLPIVLDSMGGAAIAVTDNSTVVLNAARTLFGGYEYPDRWTPATGLRALSQTSTEASVTGLNANGYASGTDGGTSATKLPVRWDASGRETVLPYFSSGGATASAINAIGDVAGNALTDAGALSYPVIWSLDGNVQQLPGLGAVRVVALSNAGRLVGDDIVNDHLWTYYRGELTQLVSPDAQAPRATGVNTCGSIIAIRATVSYGGYYYRRGGVTPSCDQVPLSNPFPVILERR